MARVPPPDLLGEERFGIFYCETDPLSRRFLDGFGQITSRSDELRFYRESEEEKHADSLAYFQYHGLELCVLLDFEKENYNKWLERNAPSSDDEYDFPRRSIPDICTIPLGENVAKWLSTNFLRLLDILKTS
ncbi:hypothetical protein J6590_055955 [Homalodisca vitripennis]|nr:hypothetical protein J6590_055955 [Homalodisca vitripennis]